jgi:uncharacterized membrane protein required for colicin V production
MDILGLLFVGVFAFLGVLRGLWWQVIRLVGVVAAILLARTLGAPLASAILGWLPDVDPRVAHGSAWLLVFVAGLAFAALLGSLGKSALETLQLDLLDRIGGLLAGVVTGLLCFSAFLVALGWFAPQHWLLDHVPGTRSEALVDLCARRVPLLLSQSGGEQWNTAFAAVHAQETQPAPPASR